MEQKTIVDMMRAALENPGGSFLFLEQLISEELHRFEESECFQQMQDAEAYYRNRSGVQKKTNDVPKRSNTKIEHPILKKLVDQKINYLLAKPWTVSTENEVYGKALNDVFNQKFRRRLKAFGRDAVKYGVSYLQPYYTQEGKLDFMLLPPMQVRPIWMDSAREQLFAFIRSYEIEVYEGLTHKPVRVVEFWWDGGMRRYYASSVDSGRSILKPDTTLGDAENGYTASHLIIGGKPYNWEKVPLIWLRYNDEELPLCYYIKELIDDINWQTSVTADVLRDVAKFIFILKNYGGADLGEFLRDLNRHLAIKVSGDGGVDKLEPSLNIDAVMRFLENQRRDLYDYAAAVDTKDPELGNASGTAINFRYMDLDADCAAIAAEMQEAFAQMKIFLDVALQLERKGNFSKQEFSIVFNMDLPVNETDIINNAKNSKGIVSDKTIRENHPWVEDAEEERLRMEEEQQEKMKQYGEGMFGNAFSGDGGDVADEE